jgi:hypothetical protein
LIFLQARDGGNLRDALRDATEEETARASSIDYLAPVSISNHHHRSKYDGNTATCLFCTMYKGREIYREQIKDK